MAQAVKTVRYAWPMLASVADATVTDMGTQTIYIPETTSRTIRSAFLMISFQDITTLTGATITEFRAGVQIAAVGTSTFTETDDLVNSGENLALILGPIDFTSYFVTNFGSGSSQTVRVEVFFDQNTGVTLGMVNVTAELFVTYEYDDTVTTHVKTITIPLESPLSALSTTIAEIGTNQIPILTGGSGILPESSITIRDYYFIIEGNEGGDASTTDFVLGVSLDAAAVTDFASSTKALATNRYVRFIWSLKSAVPTTTAAHAFNARTTGAGSLNHVSILLVVTYEFDASASTDYFNSVEIPFFMAAPMGGTASTDPQRFSKEILIPEPATITLRQSGVRLNYLVQVSVTGLNFRVGAQSFRAYTDALGGTVAGSANFTQRIDSGGAQGAGMTLGRGANTISIDVYRTGTTALGTFIGGSIYLNYTSGKASGGFSTHNHTTRWMFVPYDANVLTIRTVTALAPNIPESSYWATAVGFFVLFHNTFVASAVALGGKVQSSEAEGNGWRDFFTSIVQTDGSLGDSLIYVESSQFFARHPTDPDTNRLGLETSRDYRLYSPATSRFGVVMMVTHHAIGFTFSGTVTPNPGAGVTITIHRVSNGERLFTTTTDSSGNFSVTVYDSVLTYFAQGRLSSTRYGRSDNAAPGSAANIDFDPGGSGIKTPGGLAGGMRG